MAAGPSSRGLSTSPARSALMRQVSTRNSAPERVIRSHLHACGLRFRLHGAGLPGRPDIVLAGRRAVVFVHGCFWHGHDCVHGRVKARTNTDYWSAKLADNQARDRRQVAALTDAGWTVEIVWECQCSVSHALDNLVRRLQSLPLVKTRVRRVARSLRATSHVPAR